MELLEVHARLEQKRAAALRRQQRELQRQRKEAEARQKMLEKLAARCREMQQEERLSVAMEIWYREEEARKMMETQRLEDLKLFATISETRRRVTALALPHSTPGLAGADRLRVLEARIEEKQLALKKAHDAKVRLDALPEKRRKLRRLMHAFVGTSLRSKIERAVYHQHWNHLVPLFEPASDVSSDLLNHESVNGFTPVLVAIFKGKLSVLRKLLELGASPDLETKAGATPLLAAVMTGDIVAVNILLEFKVDLDHETKNGTTAVLLAVDKGREAILRMLLDEGANVDGVNKDRRSSLIQAAISGCSEVLRVLLAYGASKELRDGDGKAAVDWATQLGNPAMSAMLGSSLTGATLMAQLQAEEQEEGEEVQSSLSANRVIRKSRIAEMEKAMRGADLARIKELLSTEQLSPNYEDPQGNSPLLVICAHGTSGDVDFCLRYHCIPSHQNREGTSALMIACKRGEVGMIKLLMQCGCSLLTRDFCGRDAYCYLNAHDQPDLTIQFTKLYRTRTTKDNSAFLLGTPVVSTEFPTAEYSISVAHAEVLFEFGSVSGRSSSSLDETDSQKVRCQGRVDEEFDDADHTDPAIRQWGVKQQTLKRDCHRRQLYEEERRRVLAVRNQGRRNGLIAPLPSDPTGRLRFPTCDNCESSRARKRCIPCDQVLCDKCHARLHELAQRRHHHYQELEPELYVGNELRTVAQTNQETSLQHSVKQSELCVAAMRDVVVGKGIIQYGVIALRSSDSEGEKYQRRQRVAKEKSISQLQIDIPVAAAKRAAQVGEEIIYTHPAELELAGLYTTQKKYEKANEVLFRVETLLTSSLGILHPTMLKISMAKARVLQEAKRMEESVRMLQDGILLFEGILPPDDKDLAVAIAMLLGLLDSMERYEDAVQICRHLHRVRSRAFPATHESILESRERLDSFISKRETVTMSSEDLVLLDKLEQERRRMEELTYASERHLAAFQKLLLDDPEGFAAFLTFARQEFAEDLVGFWIAVEQFKKANLDSKTLRSRAVYIFLTYIKSRRIKVITAAQRKKIKKAITTPGRKLSCHLYDDVQAQIFDLVYKGVYARYLAHNNK